MPKNPPEGYPRISPYVYYEDAAAAIDWLTKAFGFKERMRIPNKNGRVMHAELELDGGVVMLATPERENLANPKRLGTTTSSIYAYVDDIDAHFEQARSAGAEILQEPEDMPYGDRHYGAKDPEGQEWWFGQHVRDVSPEEYGATTAVS
jgi:PhnB protein